MGKRETKECRFDYVISAVKALQQYSKSCPNDVYTIAYINQAQSDLNKLKEIESNLYRNPHQPEGNKTVGTVISELQEISLKYKKEIVGAARLILKLKGEELRKFKKGEGFKGKLLTIERMFDKGVELGKFLDLMKPKKQSCKI